MKNKLSDWLKKFPSEWSEVQKQRAKTLFLKKVSLELHKFYGGKIEISPKAGLWDFDFLNLWYTPGVSAVSTAIRDDNSKSLELTFRGNSVAIVSDSTRVLGDGDCTSPGGLGVMEGKAYLMNYLGGIDAFPICINSKDENGVPSANKIVEFVKMCSPSFSAINLEDISYPNCYTALDRLRKECNIPVWHDDAQGTACVVVAGIINSLRLTNRKIKDTKFVLIGAGASNTTVASFLLQMGAKNIILFDSRGALHNQRRDLEVKNSRGWELCQKTNPQRINTIETAIKGSDFIIALSKPNPKTIKGEWIGMMNKKPIVFACANPIPEIYPHLAIEAGAYIVATGRGDYPNQINNSLGFPGILKGTILCRAKKITDKMAIQASYAIADFSAKEGMNSKKIVTKMENPLLHAFVASKVACAAIAEGVAQKNKSEKQFFNLAKNDILTAQKKMKWMMKLIKKPKKDIFKKCLYSVIAEIK